MYVVAIIVEYTVHNYITDIHTNTYRGENVTFKKSLMIKQTNNYIHK